MDEKIPHSKTEIANSDIKVGGNFQQAASIYNNTYIQGQTLTVPSRLIICSKPKQLLCLGSIPLSIAP